MTVIQALAFQMKDSIQFSFAKRLMVCMCVHYHTILAEVPFEKAQFKANCIQLWNIDRWQCRKKTIPRSAENIYLKPVSKFLNVTGKGRCQNKCRGFGFRELFYIDFGLIVMPF